MTKIDFEYSIEKWITKFMEYDYELTLIEIFRNENISKIAHPILNQMQQAQLCDFKCDFIVLIEHVHYGRQLVFINRFTRSIGLTDIGEMLIYSQLAKPLYAFLVSNKGHSKEINSMLVNDEISSRLFGYDSDKSIILFALREAVSRESVLPLYMRDWFYEKIGNT